MTSPTLRRLRRGLTLSRRWIAYLATTEEGRATAFGDFRRWVSTTLLHHDLSELDLAWLTFPAIRWLTRSSRPGWRVFEWGSGASTLFLARRGCRVVSVEHDAEWHRRLAARLGEHPGLVLRLVPPAPDGPGPGRDEGPDGSAAGSFADYVAAIDGQPDAALDLVVVDGRARVDCAARAVSKVAPGGAVLLDDSDRELYGPAFDLFSEPTWRTLHLPGPRPASKWPVFSRTTLFLRR